MALYWVEYLVLVLREFPKNEWRFRCLSAWTVISLVSMLASLVPIGWNWRMKIVHNNNLKLYFRNHINGYRRLISTLKNNLIIVKLGWSKQVDTFLLLLVWSLSLYDCESQRLIMFDGVPSVFNFLFVRGKGNSFFLIDKILLFPSISL